MVKRKRSIGICIRVTDDERTYIENKRQQTGLNMRQFLLECMKRKTIQVKPGAELVVEQLKRIGNNLNQLTRHVNSGTVPASCRAVLTQIRDEIAKVYRTWQ